MPVEPWHVRSEVPLLTRPWPGNSFGQDNLTGRIIGRMTIVGLSANKSSNSRGACWVARCACGAFEHRRTQTIRKTDPKQMMCSHCNYLEQLKLGHVP